MGFKLEPFADQIVVRPIPDEDTTSGGIIIVESAKETPTRGEVLEVGPGRYAPETGKRIEPDVCVGQVVIYKKYAGTDIKLGEDELKILKEKDILVAITEE